MFAELPDLDRDGNADSNRSGGKKSLAHIFTGNFGGKVPYTFTFMHLADAFIQSDLQCIDYAPQN